MTMLSSAMNRHHLKLTEEEMKLVARIDLRDDLPIGTDGHSVYLSNQEPILALLRSLIARQGIPKHRIEYWTDPRHNPGRTRGSHSDIFARNGSEGDEAYTHPHFKRFLRYFLYGADLPQAAIEEFEAQVGNPEWFGGSDIIALTKKTREIVRKYRLKGGRYSDQFHMLALDNGLSSDNANSVRRAAVESGRR